MRNTICAALTAITLVLCAALAGCGNASKTSTPAHAIAAVQKVAPTMGKDQIILANLCGRGDKDIFSVAEHLGVEL